MKKRLLANKLVSPVGLGCMGMSEFYGATDEPESIAVLNRAIDLGIDHFDTADMYGDGANEILLGQVIAHHPARDRLLVATKCGIARDPNDSARRIVNNSPEYIKAAWSRSSERLGTHIDLYYLHRIADHGAGLEESVGALAELLLDGKIGGVGLSEANTGLIRRANTELRKITDGRYGLAAVQTEFSLLSRDVELTGVLQTCEELDIALVAYSPIGRGLLTGQIKTLDHLAKDDFRRTLPRFADSTIEKNAAIAVKIHDVASNLGATASQVAIAWVLSRSSKVHAIPGTKRLRYLEENWNSSQITLPANIIEEMESIVKENPVHGTRYTSEMMKAYGLETTNIPDQ